MNSHRRSILALLALAGMLLRAVIPGGWMPAPRADAFLALCTADGLVRVASADSRMPGSASPAPEHHDAAPDCAFALAGALAIPAAAPCALPIRAPEPVLRPQHARHRFAASPPGSRLTRGPPV